MLPSCQTEYFRHIQKYTIECLLTKYVTLMPDNVGEQRQAHVKEWVLRRSKN